MATLNPLFGRMKGKYGGSVMYSNNGKQCMRERVLEVSNPRSSKQAIQRCIMATVNQLVTAFTPVLNNAIESETSRARNLAKIRSYNLNILRQLAANGDGAYCPKGAQFVAPNDYLISRGNLRGMIPLRDAAARAYLANRGGLVFTDSDLDVGDITLSASSIFPSVRVGDQITILASMTEDIAEGSLSAYCRFAFKDDVTQALIYSSEGAGAVLNPAAIDLTKADGDWQKLKFVFEPDGIDIVGASSILISGLVLDASSAIQCAGVIVSREAERKRSTSYMVSKLPDDYFLNEVYPTYMGNGTPIDMPSEVYLNNDADVTPPSPNDLIGITMNSSVPLVLPHQFGTSVSPATIMILVPRGDYSLPGNFTVRVNYKVNDVAKVASFSPLDTATVDDVTWQLSGANIQINRAEQTGGTNQVTVTSVTYVDRAAGINKTWE